MGFEGIPYLGNGCLMLCHVRQDYQSFGHPVSLGHADPETSTVYACDILELTDM